MKRSFIWALLIITFAKCNEGDFFSKFEEVIYKTDQSFSKGDLLIALGTSDIWDSLQATSVDISATISSNSHTSGTDDYINQINNIVASRITDIKHNRQSFYSNHVFIEGLLMPSGVQYRYLLDTQNILMYCEYRLTDNEGNSTTEKLYFSNDSVICIEKLRDIATRKDDVLLHSYTGERIYFTRGVVLKKIKFQLDQTTPNMPMKSDTTSNLASNEKEQLYHFATLSKLMVQVITPALHTACNERSITFFGGKDSIQHFFNKNYNRKLLKDSIAAEYDAAFVIHIKVDSMGRCTIDSTQQRAKFKYPDTGQYPDKFYMDSKIVVAEISRLSSMVKWIPAQDNCKPYTSKKTITVSYDQINGFELTSLDFPQ